MHVLRREMDHKRARRIRETMQRIAADPFARDPQVEPLRGRRDAFRRRFGDWRVVYRVDRAERAVYVEAVAHRREVYR